MSEEIKKVISIDTGESPRTVKGLRKEISDLKDALLNVEKGSEQWQEITKQLVSSQEELASVTKITKETVDVASDSIVGMEREYKALYNTYKLLSEEQRNSPFGREMATQLETLSNKLNESKKEVGNYKDNIGRYTESIIAAFSAMGGGVGTATNSIVGAVNGAANAIKALDGVAVECAKGTGIMTAAVGALKKAFDVLLAHPIVAVVAAIVAVFMKAAAAIKQNEELMMRLKEAFAAFEPIGNLIKNLFDKIASSIVWLVEQGAKLVAFLKGETLETQKLAKAENNLIKNRRKYNELNAQDKARVETLREEARTSADLNEQLEKYNEARRIQNEIDQRNIELAAEELRILEAEAALAPNDAAANEKLSQAKVKLAEANAAAAKNTQELDEKIKAVSNTLANGLKVTNNTTNVLKELNTEIKNYYETRDKRGKTAEQLLEEERKKWLEIAKNIKGADVEINKYYNDLKADLSDNRQIDINTNIVAKEDTFSGVYEKLLGLTGNDLQAMDLGKVYSDLLSKAFGNVELTEDVNEAFKNIILDASFPDVTDVQKRAGEYIDSIGEAMKQGFGKGADEYIAVSLRGFLQAYTYASDKEIDKMVADTENRLQHFRTIFKDYMELPDSEVNEILSSRKNLIEGIAKYSAQIAGKIENTLPDVKNDLYEAIKGYADLQVQYASAVSSINESADTDIEKSNKLVKANLAFNEQLRLQMESIAEITEEYKDYSEALTLLTESGDKVATMFANGEMDAIEEALLLANAIERANAAVEKFKNNDLTKGLGEGLVKASKLWRDYGNAVQTVMDAVIDVEQAEIQQRLQAGKISQEQAENEFEKIKSLQIAMATVNMLSGAISAFASPDLPTWYAKLAAMASVIATGTANIIKIKNTEIGSAGSAGADIGATIVQPLIDESSPYQYTRNLYTAQEEEELNREIWVSVTDINNAQAKVTDRNRETTF